MVSHRIHRIAPDRDDTSFFSPSPAPADGLNSTLSLKLNEQNEHLISNLSSSTLSSQKPSYTPPWTEPYIIGVAGNSGSGKTSVSQKIILELNQPWTVLLSFDNFYNPLSPEQRIQAYNSEYDFDTPESLDLDLLVDCVKSLKNGNRTEVPVYSFVEHNRTSKTTTIYGANVIIIEGIYALYDKRLLDMMDATIYVDTDLDICLARRLNRDIIERKRELHGVIKQWETFVKPNMVRYVNKTMNNADLVIPRGLDNTVAINLMIKHIQNQLATKSAEHLKHLRELGKLDLDVGNSTDIKILPNTNHLRGVHSLLLCKDTPRTDFIFYFDIISNHIMETALEFLSQYDSIEVPTTGTNKFQGLRQVEEVVAVNIIRSGDCFMSSIKKSVPEIAIGKLLIQSDSNTGEPQLHTESLPPSITDPSKVVFLFDAQIISGAASIMAIQVLVDYGVKIENIVLCSYLSTEIGLRRIVHAFPGVKLVLGKLSNMDEGKSHQYNVEGFRDTDWIFSNRFIDSLYFGTD